MTSRQDFYTSIVLIIFSAAVVFESLRMPLFEARGGTFLTAPGLVPGALGLILGVCGIVMLIRSVAGSPGNLPEFAPAAEVAGDDENLTDEPQGVALRRLLIMLVLSLGYAGFLVGLIEFWLATFIFVSLSIALFEWRPENPPAKRYRLLAYAVVQGLIVAFAVTYVFERIFLVRLP